MIPGNLVAGYSSFDMPYVWAVWNEILTLTIKNNILVRDWQWWEADFSK